MGVKIIVLAALGLGVLSGCAERLIQDVTVQDSTLIVRECVLDTGTIWPEKCFERRYPLARP